MEIRHATENDIYNIAKLERICFPVNEAANSYTITNRVKRFPNCFWLGFSNGMLVSLINGCVTDNPNLCDEMFEKAALHNEQGSWQMLFSVCTNPNCRGNGFATQLLNRVIVDCKQRGKKGIVLTCKKELILFYSRFGFLNEGVSSSIHGGAVWYQMRKRL